MFKSRAIIATAAAVVGIVCALPAGAGDFAAPPTASVKYDDLDLSNERDAKKLYSRLRVASRQICAQFEGREANRRAEWRACYEATLSKAVAQVNREQVTLLHQRARSERPS